MRGGLEFTQPPLRQLYELKLKSLRILNGSLISHQTIFNGISSNFILFFSVPSLSFTEKESGRNLLPCSVEVFNIGMITQSRKDVCRICDKCDGAPKREEKTPRRNCRGEVARGRNGERNGIVTSRICNILRCRAKISRERNYGEGLHLRRWAIQEFPDAAKTE